MSAEDFKISWEAEIVPCKSLAGIPLNACAGALDTILSSYRIDTTDKLYRFKMARHFVYTYIPWMITATAAINSGFPMMK